MDLLLKLSPPIKLMSMLIHYLEFLAVKRNQGWLSLETKFSRETLRVNPIDIFLAWKRKQGWLGLASELAQQTLSVNPTDFFWRGKEIKAGSALKLNFRGRNSGETLLFFW